MFRSFRFKITIAALLLVGAAFIYLQGYYALGYLPRNLGDARVLASYNSFVFREGCGIYVFELEEIVSNRISETGISYLQGDTKPRAHNDEKNPYSEWRRTPVPSDNYAERALYCSKEIKPELKEQIRRGMNNASGYYTMTKNREGVIVVLPNERLAASLYYG
jgi:hypothetical protein